MDNPPIAKCPSCDQGVEEIRMVQIDADSISLGSLPAVMFVSTQCGHILSVDFNHKFITDLTASKVKSTVGA